MRPLTEGESKTVFEKLANYTGKSLTNLLTDTAPGKDGKPSRFVFRVQESRVYYVREDMANLATSVARDNLLCLGNCIGKLTKTGKFRLHITALDIIAPHARAKIWVKPNGEMPFLYGGHIVKAHVGRWSEDCPEHQGIIVYSMNEYVMRLYAAHTKAHANIFQHSSWFRCHSPLLWRGKASRPHWYCCLQTGRLRRVPQRRRHTLPVMKVLNLSRHRHISCHETPPTRARRSCYKIRIGDTR
jgi:60S ribosome subunit biogenesis protein NIP7